MRQRQLAKAKRRSDPAVLNYPRIESRPWTPENRMAELIKATIIFEFTLTFRVTGLILRPWRRPLSAGRQQFCVGQRRGDIPYRFRRPGVRLAAAVAAMAIAPAGRDNIR